MRKGRPFLNMVVGDEVEGAVLREDCGFIVNGAIFEIEEGVRSEAVRWLSSQLDRVLCGRLRYADRCQPRFHESR